MQKAMRKEYTENLERIRSEFLQKLQEIRVTLEKSLNVKVVESFDFKNFNKEIQQFESEMEQKIFKIISLQAPISKDLRLLLSTLKSTNDLRRIGKTIQRISKVSKKYFVEGKTDFTIDPTLISSFDLMGKSLLNMFDKVIGIFLAKSERITHEKAMQFQKEFSREDDNVDSLFKETLNQLIADIQNEIDSKKQAKLMTESLLMIRHMERIGDHLCNIAERILYIETGVHFHIS
jgi:phosphate transport system protein